MSVALLYKIFPSDAHAFVNSCSIVAFFRISMRFGVKLSIILTLDPFRLFLLEKDFFLKLYPLSVTIIGLGLFWPGFFFRILCVQSRSAGEISMFIFVDIVSITKSSVTSSSVSTIPWTKRQFRREHCSWLSFFIEIFNFLIHYRYIFFQVLDYFFSFFPFFFILVKPCGYKVNCFIQIF